MTESRRDHACLYVEFERSRGVLVTGGQGARDEVTFPIVNSQVILQVLASAEFYDLETQQWEAVGSMQVARTEHVISLVYGLPTVIGGVNGGQFISSMEQFDKSEESIDAPFQREWNIINQVAKDELTFVHAIQVLTSPRYEHTVASIPASKVYFCF